MKLQLKFMKVNATKYAYCFSCEESKATAAECSSLKSFPKRRCNHTSQWLAGNLSLGGNSLGSTHTISSVAYHTVV